jgi:flagellar basal body rod protein FlgC
VKAYNQMAADLAKANATCSALAADKALLTSKVNTYRREVPRLSDRLNKARAVHKQQQAEIKVGG